MARIHQTIASRPPSASRPDAMREDASSMEGSAAYARGLPPAESHAPQRSGEARELDRIEPALLRRRWRSVLGRPAPESLSRQLMIRILAWREQIARLGDIDASTRAALAAALRDDKENPCESESAWTPRPGSVLVREHDGVMHRVMALDQGYAWNGRVFASLSAVAGAITGTKWNGRRFFGLDRKAGGDGERLSKKEVAAHASGQMASKRVAGTKTETEPAGQVATRAGQKHCVDGGLL